MIPPMGICQIKTYLEAKGYPTKTVDLNTLGGLENIYKRYFEILGNNVPDPQKGNFYSIGHDVLRNHMMAYIIRSEREINYFDLLKIIIEKTYFTELGLQELKKLDKVIEEYFTSLSKSVLELVEKENLDCRSETALKIPYHLLCLFIED